MARHVEILLLLALPGGEARAQTPAPLPLKELAAGAVAYEPVRLRLTLTGPLAVTTGRGVATWAAGTTIVQTRDLRTMGADSYAYVITEDGTGFGFVSARELAARSAPAAPSATPRGLLAALAALSPGRNKQDAAGAWTENAGVKNLPGAPAPKFVALTVDLCPNFQRFEAGLFDELATLGKARGKPLPVTAFVSGYWLMGSQKRRGVEVQKLGDYARSPDLALTIANHSLTHPYLKGAVSLARNFLLKPGADVKKEALGNELEILRAGLVPAPYFRFPGLISSGALERAVRETFSLIVFGKGSWPGIGDPINLGDVVLVHGNGGEPAGVHKLEDWLRAHRAEIVAGQIDFAPPSAFIPD